MLRVKQLARLFCHDGGLVNLLATELHEALQTLLAPAEIYRAPRTIRCVTLRLRWSQDASPKRN